MGSGERSKRSRSFSASSDSSDSERSHERKEKRKHKHKKHKKEHKKSKDKDKDKALLAEKAKKAKEFLQQHLKSSSTGGSADTTAAGAGPGSSAVDRGPVAGKPAGTPDIGADDYFARAPEFTAWVQEAKHMLFNELTSEQSRELFASFVTAWNGGQLPLKYYQGLVVAPKKRTAHDWGLKGAAAKPARGMAAFMEDERERQHQQRAGARATELDDRKRWKADQKLLVDELLPKAFGREAAVEARMARREAARAREDSPELMRVTGGGDVMGGGGDDSFAAAKAREESRNQWRNRAQAAKRDELAAKLAAAQEAEEAKMASLRALVAAGPISIPKRQPQ